jgi:hypothetical protein
MNIVPCSRKLGLLFDEKDDFQPVLLSGDSAIMVKPLIPKVTADDARRHFGIGTDRFLVSWLDVT